MDDHAPVKRRVGRPAKPIPHHAPAKRKVGRPAKPIPWPHDPCAYCGGNVPRRKHEGVGAWLKRSYCSPNCWYDSLRVARGDIVATLPAEDKPRRDPHGAILPAGCFERHNIVPGDDVLRRLDIPGTHVSTATALGN